MAGIAWQDRIRHIQDGEPVTGGVASRPDQTLEANTRYLKQLVELALAGQVLVARGVTVDPDVLSGQPVYFRKSTQQFERALAGMETASTTGTLVPTEACRVFGVVYNKQNQTLADVVLSGWLPLDIGNALDETLTAGQYYLSAVDAGKLTVEKPPVSVPVLWADGNGNVLVQPAIRDFLEDHVHYRFSLICRPSGDLTTDPSGAAVITDADTRIRGWLPADHAIFNGRAPTGAQFGYNLPAHSELQLAFPPIPLEATVLVWDKGIAQGGAEVPRELAKITKDGIWWMSNCPGEVPWPDGTYIDRSSSSSVGSLSSSAAVSSSSSSDGTRCVDSGMQLTLYFTKMTFLTDKTVVTSLQTEENSPLIITDLSGNAATRGALLIRFVMAFLQDDAEQTGAQVIKTISDGRFKRGPVAEGLIADGDIDLDGTIQKTVEDPDDEDATVTLHMGRIKISRTAASQTQELSPTVARLSDAEEVFLDGVPYLSFRDGYASEVLYQFQVPLLGLPDSPKMKFRAMMLGRAAGTLAALSATVTRIPYSATPTNLFPLSSASLTFNTAVAVTANQQVTITSAEFSVVAGDTVLIAVSRTASDGYSGEMGIVRAVGITSP